MAVNCIFKSTCKEGKCQFCNRKCNGDIGENLTLVSDVQIYDENMACAVTELYQKSKGNKDFKPTFVNVSKEDLEALVSGGKVLVIDNSVIIAIGTVEKKERDPYRIDRTEKEEPADESNEECSDNEESTEDEEQKKKNEEFDKSMSQCNHRFLDGSSAIKDYGSGAYICKICGETFDNNPHEYEGMTNTKEEGPVLPTSYEYHGPTPKVTLNNGGQSKVADIQEE